METKTKQKTKKTLKKQKSQGASWAPRGLFLQRAPLGRADPFGPWPCAGPLSGRPAPLRGGPPARNHGLRFFLLFLMFFCCCFYSVLWLVVVVVDLT